MARKTGGTVRSVEHAFTILRELYDGNGASLAELSTRVELSKSTIHSHLQTLEDLGYVTRRGSEYDLGLRFLTFGGYVRDKDRLYQVAKEGADELSEKTGELAAVSTEAAGENLYLYQAEGANAMSLDSHVGARLPLHCTATGKAMLAELPADRVEGILDERGLPAATENTITDPEVLYEELGTIKERGIAFDKGERIAGMRGVGSAIVHGERGTVIGAIGVTGPTNRMSSDKYETEIPELISKITRMVEINVTYS
jgi:DNA-binding IclR family transcriptional regulator